MFGVYFHNLSSYGGLMPGMISGQAANADGQERIFNHIKRITKRTCKQLSPWTNNSKFVRSSTG